MKWSSCISMLGHHSKPHMEIITGTGQCYILTKPLRKQNKQFLERVVYRGLLFHLSKILCMVP